MYFSQLLCSLAILVSLSNYCQAQSMDDPFYMVSSRSADAAALSPSELPEFHKFIADNPNLRVATPIMPVDLNTLYQTKTRMFVLDTRSQHEYDVSHLPTARRVGYEDFTVEKVWMLDRNTTIILYSTDGKRCNLVAGYLRMMGFVDVRRIEGSIIGWLNGGYTVLDKDGKETLNVVVQNKEEAKKLKRGHVVH